MEVRFKKGGQESVQIDDLTISLEYVSIGLIAKENQPTQRLPQAQLKITSVNTEYEKLVILNINKPQIVQQYTILLKEVNETEVSVLEALVVIEKNE